MGCCHSSRLTLVRSCSAVVRFLTHIIIFSVVELVSAQKAKTDERKLAVTNGITGELL